MDENNTEDKPNLQNEKLKLEVEELRKQWYQKTPYISIMLTAVIAILTFILTLSSGIIDTERKTLELKKTMLEKDIKDFETTKGLLADSIEFLKTVLAD